MSPFEIQIMLWYSYSPLDYNTGRGIPYDFIKSLEGDGMLVQMDGCINPLQCYGITPKGRAYVAALCSVPLPKAVTTWVFESKNNTVNIL